MFDVISSLRWQDILDILIVGFIIYQIIVLIRGTRAVQMLVGIGVLIVVYFLAREFEFMTLYWLLGTFLSSLFIIVIIIFQRDIRRALMQVGQTPFSKSFAESLHDIEEIIAAVIEMSRRRMGALIVLEKETGLKEYLDFGRSVDAIVSKELLMSIFHTSSPLHDGGVIVRQNRIANAGCLMPLTKNPYISRQLGTRHRAAIGISEDSDAVSIVVSEETGHISLAQHGAITADLDESALRSRLKAIFAPKESTPQQWRNWLNRT